MESVKDIVDSTKETESQVLRLSERKFTNEFEKACKDIPDLKRVSVRECNGLTNFDWLVEARNIEEIKASSNASLIDISLFSRFPLLSVVDLSSCINIADFDVLKHCSLKHLDISGLSNMVQIPSIAHMKWLKLLSIEGTKIDDTALSAISQLTNLEYLNISNTKITSLSFISKLSRLKVLVCSNIAVTDFDQSALPDTLEYLNISKCNEVKSFESLKHLGKLKYLNIKGIGKSNDLVDLWHLIPLKKSLCSAASSNPDNQKIDFDTFQLKVEADENENNLTHAFFEALEGESYKKLYGAEIKKRMRREKWNKLKANVKSAIIPNSISALVGIFLMGLFNWFVDYPSSFPSNLLTLKAELKETLRKDEAPLGYEEGFGGGSWLRKKMLDLKGDTLPDKVFFKFKKIKIQTIEKGMANYDNRIIPAGVVEANVDLYDVSTKVTHRTCIRLVGILDDDFRSIRNAQYISCKGEKADYSEWASENKFH